MEVSVIDATKTRKDKVNVLMQMLLHGDSDFYMMLKEARAKATAIKRKEAMEREQRRKKEITMLEKNSRWL